MSIQTALVAIKSGNSTLNALISTRFHPDILPQNVVLPAVRFQVISKPRSYAFAGNPTLSHPRVQIDGYATTDAGRTTLANALRGAFNRYNSASIGGEAILDIRIENETESLENPNTAAQSRRISMDLLIDLREPTS